MKGLVYLISIVVLFACDFTGDKKGIPSHPGLNTWLAHYQKSYPNLQKSDFTLIQESEFSLIEGNVLPSTHEDFKNHYRPFLIPSPFDQKYLDLDSYQWQLDKEGRWIVQIDQEIALVDLDNNRVKRLAFYGSTEQAESAFWQNKNLIYVLGMNDENHLFIQSFNLNTKRSKYYLSKNPHPVKPTFFKSTRQHLFQ